MQQDVGLNYASHDLCVRFEVSREVQHHACDTMDFTGVNIKSNSFEAITQTFSRENRSSPLTGLNFTKHAQSLADSTRTSRAFTGLLIVEEGSVKKSLG